MSMSNVVVQLHHNDRLCPRFRLWRSGRRSGVLHAVDLARPLDRPAALRVSRLSVHADPSLHFSSALLDASFDPSPPIAASAYIGPSYPTTPSFTELLRQKWNQAIGRAVTGARETDWIGVGKVAFDEARVLASKLGNAAEGAVEKAEEDVRGGLESDVMAAQITGLVDGAANPAAYDMDKASILSRTDIHVDRKPQEGEKHAPGPKRLC